MRVFSELAQYNSFKLHKNYCKIHASYGVLFIQEVGYD